jgi:hypothetical protein
MDYAGSRKVLFGTDKGVTLFDGASFKVLDLGAGAGGGGHADPGQSGRRDRKRLAHPFQEVLDLDPTHAAAKEREAYAERRTQEALFDKWRPPPEVHLAVSVSSLEVSLIHSEKH